MADGALREGAPAGRRCGLDALFAAGVQESARRPDGKETYAACPGEAKRAERLAGPKNPAEEPRSKASPARLAALDVVRAVRERDAFAQDVIGTRIDRSDLSSEDRAFATKLALGVVSASGTLDEVIDRALNAPDDVKPDVRDCA